MGSTRGPLSCIICIKFCIFDNVELRMFPEFIGASFVIENEIMGIILEVRGWLGDCFMKGIVILDRCNTGL